MASNSTSDDSVPSEQDTPMDDSILFDGEGNIQSAQKKTPENDKQPQPGPERLSPDNFRIVREHPDEVRVLTVTKDNLRHFQDTNLRLFAQNARPRWMGKPLSPPILPEMSAFLRTSTLIGVKLSRNLRLSSNARSTNTCLHSSSP